MGIIITTCEECTGNEKTRRAVEILFKREQLLYDIENIGYVVSDLVGGEDDPDTLHPRHLTADIGQDGNIDRVTRVLNLAMSEAVEALYPYTKHELPADTEPLDDVLEEPGEYRLVLYVPDGFSPTTVRYLRDLVHELLVCRVLADWLSLTSPAAAPTWEARAASALDKAKEAVTARTGRTRRPMKPF